MKRKKALAALLNCEYRKRGRNVRTLYLAVLKKRETQRNKGLDVNIEEGFLFFLAGA